MKAPTIFQLFGDDFHTAPTIWVVSADALSDECVGEDINGIDLFDTIDRTSECDKAAQVEGQNYGISSRAGVNT